MNSKEIIENLIEEGESFTYENFSSKGNFGYPESFTPEYTSWYLRVEESLKTLFGVTSSIFRVFEKSKKVRVLGNEIAKFNRAKGYILGALKTAKDIQEKPVLIKNKEKPKITGDKVFIVHGHDGDLKNQLELFLKKTGLEPIILHKQSDEGQTIIEKFEKHGNEVGYAFILLTPDDIGYSVEEEQKREEDKLKKLRARQNVIFEFGYFVGKLGRERVSCIYKPDLELPTDISGVIYKKINQNIETLKKTYK